MVDEEFLSELAWEFSEDIPEVFADIVLKDQKLARKVVKKLVEIVVDGNDDVDEIIEKVLKAHRDEFIVRKKTVKDCERECEPCSDEEKKEDPEGCEEIYKDCIEGCLKEDVVEIPLEVHNKILDEIAEKLVKWVMRQ